MFSSIDHQPPAAGKEKLVTLGSPPPRREYGRSKITPGSDSSSPPWTASRCHRLLRPLLSHLASLRRETTREALQMRSRPLEPAPKRPRVDDEPLSRKKSRYTYSLKGSRKRDGSVLPTRPPTLHSHKMSRVLKPGEVMVPSPVLRRVRGSQESISPVQPKQPPGIREPRASRQCTSLGNPRRSALEGELSRLRDKIGATRYGLHESIFRALEALLRATEETAPLVAPKSLLGMCLRRVPQYISELEHWEEQNAEENGTRSAIEGSKVAFEVYSELEVLGVGEGWPHLRAVLRAHGIRLLRDAISEGLFDATFPALLVKLCTRCRAHAEAEELLEAVAAYRPATAPTPSDGSSMIESIQLMVNFATDTGRASFMLAQLSGFLSSGHLDETWISSEEFGPIWSSAARAIPETETCDAALAFIATSITVLCNSRRGSLPPSSRQEHASALAHPPQQIIISILASLGATAILAIETISRSSDPVTLAGAKITVQRVAFIIETCLATTNSGRREEIKTRRYLLHLTKVLTAIHAANMDMVYDKTTPVAAVEVVWGSGGKGGTDDRRQRRLYNDTMALVAAMAHCCGRGASAPPRQYLTDLCNHLGTIDVPAKLFRSKERDAAFLLADRTSDLRDLAFAETLQADRTPARKRTPAKGSPHSGTAEHYRWEAGISEWIAVSPVLTKPKRIRRMSANPAAGNRILGSSRDEAIGTSAALSGLESLDGNGRERHSCRRVARPKQEPSALSRSLLSLVPDDDMGVGQENLHTAALAEGRRGNLSRNSTSSSGCEPVLQRIRFLEPQSDDELGL